jgi:transcription elongation GreA/GreB family factor
VARRRGRARDLGLAVVVEVELVLERLLRGLGPAARVNLDRQARGGDAQIARIRRELADGVVVADGDPLVSVGCAVRLADETGERTVVIGGLSAANPSSGRLSYESPLAHLLLGRRVGDEIEVGSGDAARPTRIVAISPMPGPWPLQPESKATGGREAV